MTQRPSRLRYSHVLYNLWIVLAVICGCAAVWCVVFGAWPWVLGWTVGAVALFAHARLEQMDGHTHKGGVEAP